MNINAILGAGIFVIVGLVIAAILITFLPAFIAKRNGHEHTVIIFIVCFLFGWTCLAWVAMLVWACYPPRRDSHAPRERALPPAHDWGSSSQLKFSRIQQAPAKSNKAMGGAAALLASLLVLVAAGAIYWHEQAAKAQQVAEQATKDAQTAQAAQAAAEQAASDAVASAAAAVAAATPVSPSPQVDGQVISKVATAIQDRVNGVTWLKWNGNEDISAKVMVKLGVDGSLVSAEVTQSSGNPDYDAYALAMYRAALAKPINVKGIQPNWVFDNTLKHTAAADDESNQQASE